MAEVSTRIDSLSLHRSTINNKQDSISYGTFTPYYVIDSEYLKSLIIKDSGCELVESASLPIASYFSSRFANNRPSSPDSGIYSPGQEQNTPQFFSECDIQLSKLFAFLEFHLSKVESDLSVIVRALSKDSIHNPSHCSEEDRMSEDELLHTFNKDDDSDERGINILSRLREVLVSVYNSLCSSFASLNNLIDLHDHHYDNKEGAVFMEKKKARRDEIERRIESVMESLDHEIDKLHRKQDLKIDGMGHVVRAHSESQIIVDVRESSTTCVTYFHVALFLATLGLLSYMYKSDYTDKWIVYLRLLRGPFLVLLFLYLYGTNMKVWALKYIDYVTIFNHHPHGTPTPNYVFKVAGCFCVLFTVIIVLLLLLSPFTDEIPGKIAPLVMWLSIVVFLVNPLDIFLRRGRFSLILVFVRILLAPFTFVYFGDFWLADQLNSTVGILLDIQYMACYMIADTWYGNVDTSVCTSSSNGIRPVITCLPALWRLLQCVRCFYDTWKVKHLVNALKYFTTFPVVVFATMFSTKVSSNFVIWEVKLGEVGWILILWLISAFVHAVYTFIWDIYCDWGLWNFSKGTIYRPTLLYKYKAYYLFAMLLNLVLRFAWALKVTLAIVWHLDSDLVYTGLIIAEIIRRFVWNFFRVEYAHVLENQHKK